MKTRQYVIAPALLLVGLCGCAGPLNHEPTLGGQVDLEAFAPNGSGSASSMMSPVSAEKPDGVSVISHSRDNWRERTFLVPVESPSHQPVYAENYMAAQATSVQRGEYPTIETATATTGPESRRGQFWEALVAPLMGTIDFVLLAPRVIVTPPWTTVTSTGSRDSVRRRKRSRPRRA